jgi:hypothetical protein
MSVDVLAHVSEDGSPELGPIDQRETSESLDETLFLGGLDKTGEPEKRVHQEVVNFGSLFFLLKDPSKKKGKVLKLVFGNLT